MNLDERIYVAQKQRRATDGQNDSDQHGRYTFGLGPSQPISLEIFHRCSDRRASILKAVVDPDARTVTSRELGELFPDKDARET
jgi:hypothetical protein